MADEEFSAFFPEKQIAVVTIQSSKGTFSKRVEYPKGEPENPMTEEEFRTRYEGLMKFGGVKEDVYFSVYDMMNHIENEVSNLIRKL